MNKIHGVGLGTFPFSNVFSHVSKKEAKLIVQTFLDQGGKYIETAPLYQINPLMREILSDIPREAYYLSDKCVTGIDENGDKVRSGKYDSILKQCDLELRTLGVDYIDLYMMHIPPPDASPEETMSALLHLQKLGKIREIAVSNVSLEKLREFNALGRISYIQNRFSLINRSMDQEFAQYCLEHDIGNIPYQVIERGLLTNKILSGLKIHDGDLRRSKPEFNDSVQNEISQWVKTYLAPIARELDVSIETLAISWVLHQPTVPVCAVGATSHNQVLQNLKANELSLSDNTLQQIEEAYQVLASKSVRKLMGLE